MGLRDFAEDGPLRRLTADRRLSGMPLDAEFFLGIVSSRGRTQRIGLGSGALRTSRVGCGIGRHCSREHSDTRLRSSAVLMHCPGGTST
jgi:hypothetical protein